MTYELDKRNLAAAFDVYPDAEVHDGGHPIWTALASVVAPIVASRDIRMIGVEGSQGSGKSTLARALVTALEARGIKASAVSLDDFYLARADRESLAKNIHPMLQTRGVPGTHDWRQLLEVLQAHRRGEQLEVPRFDKGLDDRVAAESLNCECLILEGWCVGITPQENDALSKPVNTLERNDDAEGKWRRWVNEQIAHYVPAWSHIEFWLQLRVPSFEQVYAWRAQQELDLPATQRMSDADLRRFIQHYERLTHHLWALPRRAPGLWVELDEDHDLTRVEPSVSSND